MPAIFRGTRYFWGLVLLALLGWGCHPKPKAPALINEPVFQSEQGFRFLAPEGWIMVARANIPPGPIEKERLLVQYRRSSGEVPATLEVSVIDLPEDADVSTYLSGPSLSAEHWDAVGKTESIEAGGASGTRFHFRASVDGREMAKEVAAFRRNGHVYFFTLLYDPKDTEAVEQARRSIASLEWTK